MQSWHEGSRSPRNPIPNRIHGTRTYIYLTLISLKINHENVGKYTSTMDPMGTNLFISFVSPNNTTDRHSLIDSGRTHLSSTWCFTFSHVFLAKIHKKKNWDFKQTSLKPQSRSYSSFKIRNEKQSWICSRDFSWGLCQNNIPQCQGFLGMDGFPYFFSTISEYCDHPARPK